MGKNQAATQAVYFESAASGPRMSIAQATAADITQRQAELDAKIAGYESEIEVANGLLHGSWRTNAKDPKATSPEPGVRTSSATVEAATRACHQACASANRLGPRSSTRAASPHPDRKSVV